MLDKDFFDFISIESIINLNFRQKGMFTSLSLRQFAFNLNLNKLKLKNFYHQLLIVLIYMLFNWNYSNFVVQ